MAAITKRTKKWQVRIPYKDRDGNRKVFNKAGFVTKKEAELYVADFEHKLVSDWLPTDVAVSHVFSDYFLTWYQDFKKAKISDRTKQRYLITQRALEKYFGNAKLENITRRDYQKFINNYGMTHAKDTVHKVNSLVNACVKNAIYEDILAKNFCDGVELVYDPDKTKKIDYLNVEEMNSLSAFAESKANPNFTSNQMILTCIYTGARLGEIQGLKWSDINFNFKTISIQRAWNEQKKCTQPTKNESSKRIIRVNSTLISMFKNMKRRNDFVFTNQYGTIPTSNAVNKQLQFLLKTLKIDRTGFHFYSLRHTHVAYLLYCGMDLYAISKRLGHSDLATTTRIYAYIIDEYRVRTDNEVEGYLDNIGKKCAHNVHTIFKN